MNDMPYELNPSTPNSDDGIHDQSSDDEGNDPPLPASASLSNSTGTLEGAVSVKVTLRNQDRFDDEGCVSAPLLDLGLSERYRGYRQAYAHLLGVWGLPIQSAEVRKFDGLPSYWGRLELDGALERKTARTGESLAVDYEWNVVGSGPEQDGRMGTECRICWTRVTGLHRVCECCRHIAHFGCCEGLDDESCGLGCGCDCG